MRGEAPKHSAEDFKKALEKCLSSATPVRDHSTYAVTKVEFKISEADFHKHGYLGHFPKEVLKAVTLPEGWRMFHWIPDNSVIICKSFS